MGQLSIVNLRPTLLKETLKEAKKRMNMNRKKVDHHHLFRTTNLISAFRTAFPWPFFNAFNTFKGYFCGNSRKKFENGNSKYTRRNLWVWEILRIALFCSLAFTQWTNNDKFSDIFHFSIVIKSKTKENFLFIGKKSRNKCH